MNRRSIIQLITTTVAAASMLGLVGCSREMKSVDRSGGFDEFVPIYNRHIEKWIQEQKAATQKEITELESKIAKAEPAEAEKLKPRLAGLTRVMENLEFRQSIGDYLKFSDPSEIPADLKWETGMDEPEIGDPRAKKGGVFRRYISAFPPTIRPTGPNSNNSFRGDLYDYVELPLVGMHPETLGLIPGLAVEWASSKDGRTTYFKLNPKATYSDGTPINAKDFLIKHYVYISDNIVNPYYKQYYREEIAQLCVYDDKTLSISLPEAKLYAPAIAGSLTPAHPGFYKEYGPDYETRYQWRFPPTTGAYVVKDEDIVKGVSITQTRVKDWWAKDLKYYKYRYNPDKVVNVVVRDDSKAFELFRAGELDTFLLGQPNLWYEKSEMDQVYNGYIERYTFYTRYPKIPRGFYVNVIQEPVDNKDVRIGIDQSLNWQKVIDVIFRGDTERINSFTDGYGKFCDPSIQARPFSINAARESFAKAGYTEEDRDGFLTKPDGTKLSVSITYPAVPIYDKILAILREDAKACGLDLRLDGLEPTVSYKKVVQKQHQMTFTGWVISPPTPNFYQYLHSSNAFDDKGNPKPQTNNIFSWSDPESDRLSEQTRTARTEEEFIDAAWKLQRMMHDEAIFLPAFSSAFIRVGSWRWVRWPDSEFTKFSPPIVYDPHEVHVHWVDDEMKQETQDARRSGKAYPEVAKTVDFYREQPNTAPPEPETPPSEIPLPPQPEEVEAPDIESP